MKDQKCFFFVHILSPHASYRAPRPFCDAFGKPDHPKLDTSNGTLQALDSRRRLLSIADRNYLVSQYDGAVLYLDDVIKRIFDHLKQLGIYQDSLLIFLSDHGEQFQEHGRLAHGNTLYQEEIHIPLIMKPPAGFSSEALRVPAVVSAIDIAPTILDMIKIRPPDSFQGRSLLPLLRGQSLEEDIVFAELNASNALAIQKGFYKYISSYPEMSAETKNCPVLSRSEGVGHEELYDLKRDPGEIQNLSARRHDLLQEFR